MALSVESEARKALNRLRRAVEKARRELDAVRGALVNVEGHDFPTDAFGAAGERLSALETFVDEQAERLEEKILHAGGLEPGRIRRG
ncbi:MAG: hypothetical protein WEA24_10890 [Gemmatimonadota bacterium]